jgi:hypothetical protein
VKGTTNKSIKEWSIVEENKHVDTVITINEANGQVMLRVADDETLETITVRAVSKEDPEKSGTVKVTVPVPQINNVEISLLEPWVVPWLNVVDVGPGGEIEFTAKAVGKDFSRDAITWLIDGDGKNAGTTITDSTFTVDGTVISQGQLKVASGEILTSFKVQAYSRWDESKIGEVTVNVKEPVLLGANLNGPLGLAVGSGGKYKMIITGTGKVNQDVDWEIQRMSYSVHIGMHLDHLTPAQVTAHGLDPAGEYWRGNYGEYHLDVRFSDTGIIVTNKLHGDPMPAITWRNTGIIFSDPDEGEKGFIFKEVPIEYVLNDRKIIFNNAHELYTVIEDEVTGVETDITAEYDWKTLNPFMPGTVIAEDGTLSVDGGEVWGTVKITATPIADPSLIKEMEIEISTNFVPSPPQPVSLNLK